MNLTKWSNAAILPGAPFITASKREAFEAKRAQFFALKSNEYRAWPDYSAAASAAPGRTTRTPCEQAGC
jgi:hypothetical protein